MFHLRNKVKLAGTYE